MLSITLGYIVSEKPIDGVKWFVKQVSDVSDVPCGSPCLIVGYSKAKSDPRFKSILEKRLDHLTFWTFKKTEKRSDYETDIESFYSFILDRVTSGVSYYYACPYKLRYSQAKWLVNALKIGVGSCIYISDKFIYLSYGRGFVVGMSFCDLEYMGIDPSEVVSMALSNKANIVVNDSDKRVFSLARTLKNKKYAVTRFIELRDKNVKKEIHTHRNVRSEGLNTMLHRAIEERVQNPSEQGVRLRG